MTPVNYAVNPSPVNPLRYGTNTTPGTTDMTTAISNAVAVAIAGNIQMRVPGGLYLCSSSIAFTLATTFASLSIFGDGAEVTEIVWSSGNGFAGTFNSKYNSVHVRDITLSTKQAFSGAAFSLTQTSASFAIGPANDFTNVNIRGFDGYGGTNAWNYGISTNSVSNVSLSNVNVFGNSSASSSNTIAAYLQGSVTVPGVVFNFDSCSFDFCYYGILYGSYVQGVTVTGCNFTLDTIGVLYPTASGSTGDQLAISDSQFECTEFGILTQPSASILNNVQLTNNLFLVGAAASAVGVQFNLAGYFSITGNDFNPQPPNAATAIGIVLGAGSYPGAVLGNNFNGINQGIFVGSSAAISNIVINSNTFNGINVGSLPNGVVLFSNSSNCTLAFNTFNGCTTPVTDAGTGNVKAGNVGYVTRNSGVTGAIATGATVTHGLASTPTSVVLTQQDAAPTAVYPSAIGGTTFTINYAGGGTHAFSWQASFGNPA